jgi:hypothetical protein
LIIDNSLNELCEIVDEQVSVEIITKQMHHKLTISQNFNKIHVKIVKQCVCNFCGLQSVKMAQKKSYYFYINDVSFLLVMF